MMRYYPIYLDLKGRKVVVVGGGKVIWRKIQNLLAGEAQVFVIDSQPIAQISQLAKKKKITLIRRSYRHGDLDQAFIAIASTDHQEMNRVLFAEAREKNIPLNVMDQPEFCSFIMPARVVRGDLIISISTSGAIPALAKKIREDLEKSYGFEYVEFLKILQNVRNRLRASGVKNHHRKLSALLDDRSRFLHYIRKKDRKGIERLIEKTLRGS